MFNNFLFLLHHPQVSHDFAINFNPEDDECEGMERPVHQLPRKVHLYVDDTKMNICGFILFYLCEAEKRGKPLTILCYTAVYDFSDCAFRLTDT